MATSSLPRTALALVLAAAALALLAPAAFAGTQVVHGYDEHCAGGDPTDPECGFTRKVIDYARGGAPDPSKPLLLIDGDTSLEEEITSAYDPDPAFTRIAPGTPEYDATVFSTDQWSAIIVGTGVSEGGDLDPRAADILAFFNQGGGIVTFDSACSQEGYDFLPLPVSFLDCNSTSPYTVTPEGVATLGITEEETGNSNCCIHSSFNDPDPATSPLIVGARDGDGDDAVVLFARVDRRAPTSASSGCVTTSEVGVTVTDENGGSGPAAVRYQVDGGAEQTAATDSSGNARIAVSAGQHTVTFRGVDQAGNVESAANSVTVTCAEPAAPTQADETRPRLRVLGVPRTCVSRSFFIRIRARDAGRLDRVVVRRDGRRVLRRAFNGTTRASFRVRIRAAGMRSGRHRLVIQAVDEAGNRRTVRRSFQRCARVAAVPISLTG